MLTVALFVAKRFDRGEQRRLAGGPEAEEHAHGFAQANLAGLPGLGARTSPLLGTEEGKQATGRACPFPGTQSCPRPTYSML